MKIKTPGKRGGVKFIFKWGSHQPVVNAMVELISPELIVELGVGRYSTPMFLKFNAKKILHIDNDPGWLDLIKQENADIITEKSEFRLHDLSTVNIDKLSILITELDQDQKNFIDQYYKELNKEIKKINYKNLDKEIYKTHDEYLLKTSTSWTGFFIRKGIIDFENLNLLLDKHIDNFVNDLGIEKKGFELIYMNAR
jgi:hypothetical protein